MSTLRLMSLSFFLRSCDMEMRALCVSLKMVLILLMTAISMKVRPLRQKTLRTSPTKYHMKFD